MAVELAAAHLLLFSLPILFIFIMLNFFLAIFGMHWTGTAGCPLFRVDILLFCLRTLTLWTTATYRSWQPGYSVPW